MSADEAVTSGCFDGVCFTATSHCIAISRCVLMTPCENDRHAPIQGTKTCKLRLSPSWGCTLTHIVLLAEHSISD